MGPIAHTRGWSRSPRMGPFYSPPPLPLFRSAPRRTGCRLAELYSASPARTLDKPMGSECMSRSCEHDRQHGSHRQQVEGGMPGRVLHPIESCLRGSWTDSRSFPASRPASRRHRLRFHLSPTNLLPSAIPELVANLGLSAGCCAQWRDRWRIDWGD
jgi:hypothetical protein